MQVQGSITRSAYNALMFRLAHRCRLVEQQQREAPYHATFATLAARSTLAIPYLPKGAKGPGDNAQPGCRATDDLTAQAGCIGRNASPHFFGTSRARARSKRPSEPLTRPGRCEPLKASGAGATGFQ
jgi:hypothetical protein